jgi:hypothetical protein
MGPHQPDGEFRALNHIGQIDMAMGKLFRHARAIAWLQLLHCPTSDGTCVGIVLGDLLNGDHRSLHSNPNSGHIMRPLLCGPLLNGVVLHLRKIHGGGIAYITVHILSECGGIIGVEACFMRSSRNRDVSESRVDQIRMCRSIDIHENALCGQTLRTMGGHGISMIEVTHHAWIKGYGSVIVHSYRKFPLAINGFYRTKRTICDMQIAIWCSEL